MLQQIVYAIPDRPECEVLVDGEWWFGEVRMATQMDDGTWVANVEWGGPDGNRLDEFPAERVRKTELDWSRGRNVGGG